MNIRKILMQFAASLTILLTLTSSANAGVFDWISGEKAQYLNGIQSLSFGQLYGGVTKNEAKQAEPELATIQSNSIVQTNGPVTRKSTETPKTKQRYVVSVSGYSSTADQTDDSPFITARNTYVRDGIIAANFLPFGTAVKFPELFGNKIFIVEDRMNKRYWLNADIWFADRQVALKFGRKATVLEVVN